MVLGKDRPALWIAARSVSDLRIVFLGPTANSRLRAEAGMRDAHAPRRRANRDDKRPARSGGAPPPSLPPSLPPKRPSGDVELYPDFQNVNLGARRVATHRRRRERGRWRISEKKGVCARDIVSKLG